MKAIDLYAGLGCYTLALADSGIRVVAAAEKDDWRASAYREHFPGVLVHDDVEACIAAHPEADLWCAVHGVKVLEKLVHDAGELDALPRWLWLESVKEPFDELLDALFDAYNGIALWDACGRRHVVAGPVALDVPRDWQHVRLQHPDLDRRRGVSFEAQEAALELPPGWTAAAGATDRQRQGALGSASHVGMLRCVARLIAQQG